MKGKAPDIHFHLTFSHNFHFFCCFFQLYKHIFFSIISINIVLWFLLYILMSDIVCNRIVEATEKAMAPHSSTLAWKIPWTEEPGRLQSMGSRGVGHDWATSLSLFTFMHWRRKWQPIPVFLPGESRGRGSLVGYCLWGRTESDTTSDLAAAGKSKVNNIYTQK